MPSPPDLPAAGHPLLQVCSTATMPSTQLSAADPPDGPGTPLSRQGQLGTSGRGSPAAASASASRSPGCGHREAAHGPVFPGSLPQSWTAAARTPQGTARHSLATATAAATTTAAAASTGRAEAGSQFPLQRGADSPPSLPAAALPWRRCGHRKSRAASRSWKWPKGTRAHDMVPVPPPGPLPAPPPNPEAVATFPPSLPLARRRAALRRTHARQGPRSNAGLGEAVSGRWGRVPLGSGRRWGWGGTGCGYLSGCRPQVFRCSSPARLPSRGRAAPPVLPGGDVAAAVTEPWPSLEADEAGLAVSGAAWLCLSAVVLQGNGNQRVDFCLALVTLQQSGTLAGLCHRAPRLG